MKLFCECGRPGCRKWHEVPHNLVHLLEGNGVQLHYFDSSCLELINWSVGSDVDSIEQEVIRDTGG